MEPLLANLNMDGGQSQMSVPELARSCNVTDHCVSSLSAYDHNIDTGVSDPILRGLDATRGSSVLLLPVDASDILMPDITLFSPVKDRTFEMPVHTYCVSSAYTTATNTTIPVQSGPIVKQQSGWPRGKRRKLSHPTRNTPIRPTSAYLLYCRSERASFKSQHPNMSTGEIVRMLGTQWSRMKEDDKKKYIDLAAKDRQRYMDEMKEYKMSNEYKSFEKANQSEDDDLLHCPDCQMYFLTKHNKNEHMISSKHQKQVVNKFETFWTKQNKKKCNCNAQRETSDINSVFTVGIDDMAYNIMNIHSNQHIELSILKDTAEELDRNNLELEERANVFKIEHQKLLTHKNYIQSDTNNLNVALTRLLSIQKIFDDSV